MHLRKRHDNILKKVENYESLLSIPKTHRWDPMDSKYNTDGHQNYPNT